MRNELAVVITSQWQFHMNRIAPHWMTSEEEIRIFEVQFAHWTRSCGRDPDAIKSFIEHRPVPTALGVFVGEPSFITITDGLSSADVDCTEFPSLIELEVAEVVKPEGVVGQKPKSMWVMRLVDETWDWILMEWTSAKELLRKVNHIT